MSVERVGEIGYCEIIRRVACACLNKGSVQLAYSGVLR